MLSKQKDVDKSRIYLVWFSKEDIKYNPEQKILDLFEKFLGVELIAEREKKMNTPFFYIFHKKNKHLHPGER